MWLTALTVAGLCVLTSCSKPPTVATTPQEFCELCKSCAPRDVTASINAGADVKSRNDIGWTPLMAAAACNHDPAVILALVNAGGDVDASSCDVSFRDSNGRIMLMVGDSPLSLAAKGNTPEVVTAIIRSGASPNAWIHIQPYAYRQLIDAPGCEDRTLLMLAASENKNSGVIEALVQAGAKIDSKTKRGKTALEFARENANSTALAALEK